MRILDRLLSAVLALALLAGGLVVAVELVLAGLGRSPWLLAHDRWSASARTTPWSEPDLRGVFAGLVAAGVLLLVAEGARRRPQALTLAAGGAGVISQLDRRGVERWLVERVEEVEGVVSAGVRIGRASAVVEATSLARDTAEVNGAVRQTAATALESLGLELTPRLRVKVRPRGEGR